MNRPRGADSPAVTSPTAGLVGVPGTHPNVATGHTGDRRSATVTDMTHRHSVPSHRPNRNLQNALTAAVAIIATAVQAQGMWNFFGDKFHVTNPVLRGALFAFIELAILASALRARRHRIDHGTIGIDGAAVWGLAVLSGVLSATDADTYGGTIGRLVVPLVAAWMFERAVSVERADKVGRLSGIPWRITPERILVALRLADPSHREVADVARQHRLAKLAEFAHRVDKARGRRQRRLQRRLSDRMVRLNADLGLAADPVTMHELRLNLALIFQAAAEMTPAAVADLSPWRTSMSDTGLSHEATSDATPAASAGATSDATSGQTRPATSDVAPSDTSRDTKMSRPVSAPPSQPVSRSATRRGDSDKTRVARRRVARGDSCASVARDLEVSAKTVERWTADIRAARTEPTPPKVNGSADHPTLTGVTS